MGCRSLSRPSTRLTGVPKKDPGTISALVAATASEMRQSGLPEGYAATLAAIKLRIADARVKAALAVNTELIQLYWETGRLILTRRASEGWGAKVVQRLSADIQKAVPGIRGYSPRNLEYMQTLASIYEADAFPQQAAAPILWGHLQLLLDSFSDLTTIEWYALKVTEHGWSGAVLLSHVKSSLHDRQGRAITTFQRVLPPTDSELLGDILKSPYNLEFLTLSEAARRRSWRMPSSIS